MAINYEQLMAWPFEDVRHRYTQRDTMLYALGIGLGTDPCNETELRFEQVCGGDPAAVQSLDVRFSSPVYPGETIRTELWVDGKVVSFRARAVERDILVLNNGRAELR